MNLRHKHSRGFSIVELMVGSVIFVVVALTIAGVHQKLAWDSTVNRLSQKSMEYMQSEIGNLNRLVRVPERSISGHLVYRDTNGNVVNSGGSLVPYGYNNLVVSGAFAFHAESKTVVYPDVLNSQSNDIASADRISLKRKYVVQTFNQGQSDEFKQVTIFLNDSATPERFVGVTQTVILKKPDPRALDVRIAKGTASLGGTVKDKVTNGVPISPVTVTLIPSDGTPNRITVTDSSGNFLFLPPINPLISYTVQFQSTGFYWDRSLAITLSPGANMIAGNSPGVVMLSPIVNAKASFSIRSGDTWAPLANASISIFHSGVVPNSGASSYQTTTDSNGGALFNIKIPVPDVTQYNAYFVSGVSLTGYISVQWPPDRFLSLNQFAQVNRSYDLYTIKKGSLRVKVLNSIGLPNPTAKVLVYTNSNYTGLADQGTVDSNGEVTLTNLPVNTSAAPQQITRNFYVRVQSPMHLIYSLTTVPVVSITAGQVTDAMYSMSPHQLDWADIVSAVGVNLGYSTPLQAKLYYQGHQGKNINDVTVGPNPSAFLGQSLTSGGYPGTFTWSGWDPSIISVSAGTSADNKVITGLQVGVTQINVMGTYTFVWNSVPYTLTANRTYTVTCLASGTLLTVAMVPNVTTISPSMDQIFLANPSTKPSDLTYTWTASGEGSANFTPINSSGSPVANGSNNATGCRVLTASQLGSQFTIEVTVNSASIAQSAMVTKNINVDFVPLAVTLNPSGPVYTQPGYTTSINALMVGGSGNYSYTWSLTNPATGDPLVGIGTLSSTSGYQVTFSALQIGSVNATVRVLDTSSNRTIDGAVLLNVQPSGGVTGGGGAP